MYNILYILYKKINIQKRESNINKKLLNIYQGRFYLFLVKSFRFQHPEMLFILKLKLYLHIYRYWSSYKWHFQEKQIFVFQMAPTAFFIFTLQLFWISERVEFVHLNQFQSQTFLSFMFPRTSFLLAYTIWFSSKYASNHRKNLSFTI